MWKCSKCAEEVGDDFEVCWSCGTATDGTEDPNFFNDDAKEASLEPLGEGPPMVRPDERLMTVTTCNLPVEAHALRIKLEAANIPAVLTDEFIVGMDWLLANAVGGIKIQVAESNYDNACAVLGLPSPSETDGDEDEQDGDDEDDEDHDDEEEDDEEESEQDEKDNW